MFQIRSEQVAALDEAMLRSFEDEMVAHLRRFAPRLFDLRGEAVFREVIRLGLARARRYGLTNRGPVRLYVELMVMLGCDFDTDPMLPWGAATLSDPEPLDQMARAERLYERSRRYYAQVVGPEDSHLIEALRKVTARPVEDALNEVRSQRSDGLAALRAIYPEKCEAAGEGPLRELIRRGTERARGHGSSSLLSIATFIVLPFFLGDGYDRDPLYPWVSETLDHPRILDPQLEHQRLLTRARTYASEALAYLQAR